MAKPMHWEAQPPTRHAGVLFDRGLQFLKAFRALAEAGPGKWPHAAYFMLAHALELILKAHLAATGVGARELHGYGHNLRRVFEVCQASDLPLVEDVDNLVLHLAEMNGENDLRYPTPYRLTLPTAADCLIAMDALVAALRPEIVRAKLSAWAAAAKGSFEADPK